jgi:hypothetical protein
LRSGDTLVWEVQTRLPPGYTLFFVLTAVLANVPVRILIPAATIDANGLATFNIAGTVSGAWQPGRYQWVAFFTDTNGNRAELAQGVVRILPNVAGAAPVDPRSANEKLLGAIKCLLQGKALDDAQMYKIGGRELTKMALMDLLKWEGLIEARVRNERIRRGEYVPTKTIGITFGGRGQR